jgi:sulfite reductase (NADPH) flavoprotein alpha-component
VDCDVDFDDDAANWTTNVLTLLSDADQPADAVLPAGAVLPADADERLEHPTWNRTNPYTAEVSARRLLTAPGSAEEVWHYEIDLTDRSTMPTGLTYRAGDSVGIHPVNDPALVEALLAELGRGPADTVPGYEQPLGVLLTEHFEIRTPSRALQTLVAARTTDAAAAAALDSADPTALDTWMYGRDLLDLLQLAELTCDEVLETLRPLQYRDYSIASSPLVHPDHVHLTVATVRYHRGDRQRSGVASAHLADRAQHVRIHLQPNTGFRLPAADVPIIMIGPGTGIAPFRAFLQERRATGATGRSWLFFGHRRRATDFLYEQEIEDYLDTGDLTRLNLAFSRDTQTRDYVQHHMLAHAGELFAWLEAGAHIYVCGDAAHMAKDVHAALHEVVRTAGAMDDEAAHGYINDLTKQHRYSRDVY